MPETTPSCCESCDVAPRPFDSVLDGTYGGPSRLLCGRCFNLEAGRRRGLVDFEHIEFEPLTMSDVRGREHVFQFRTHLFAAGVTIDAIELTEDESEGYCFKVIGHEEGDLLELLARLVTKMRRGLANSHLEEGPHGLQISDRGIVRARIESDPEGETDMPVAVIDGHKYLLGRVRAHGGDLHGFPVQARTARPQRRDLSVAQGDSAMVSKTRRGPTAKGTRDQSGGGEVFSQTGFSTISDGAARAPRPALRLHNSALLAASAERSVRCTQIDCQIAAQRGADSRPLPTAAGGRALPKSAPCRGSGQHGNCRPSCRQIRTHLMAREGAPGLWVVPVSAEALPQVAGNQGAIELRGMSAQFSASSCTLRTAKDVGRAALCADRQYRVAVPGAPDRAAR
jgi:hypothetical protein